MRHWLPPMMNTERPNQMDSCYTYVVIIHFAPRNVGKKWWNLGTRATTFRVGLGQRTAIAQDLRLPRRCLGSLCVAGKWSEATFYGAGLRNEENVARFPLTASLVDRIGEATGAAMVGCGETLFSVLAPGSRLRAHTGSTNARLTCHMGLFVPEGATIRAGAETRTWEEGKCLVFDDSFEHEVVNDGATPRVILLMNFWHPDFPEEWREERYRELSDPDSSRFGV